MHQNHYEGAEEVVIAHNLGVVTVIAVSPSFLLQGGMVNGLSLYATFHDNCVSSFVFVFVLFFSSLFLPQPFSC